MKVETLRELASPNPPLARQVAPALAALAAVWLVVLFAYRDSAVAMVSVWNNSATYGHCFLVLPIALWMVWTRRHSVPWHAARPCWPVLIAMLGAGAGWMLASIAAVASGEQFALVVMLQLAVVGVLGTVVARAILLPIAFLLFAVPVGEFLTPTLIDRTADFTVAALQATGIPVYREGNDFLIPTGRWSVVEACSGVRYLFASLMAGTAFAYLQYSGWRKRAAFMAVSLIVPIVANWLRAYLIVLTGHLSSNEIAVGADHLIYGAVFFGIIIFILFAIGNRFRDPESAFARGAMPHPGAIAANGRGAVIIAVALGIAAVLWVPLPAAMQSRLEARTPTVLEPVAAPSGWNATAATAAKWTVAFRGARQELTQSYERDGLVVTLRIGYFADQRPNHEMIAWAHAFLRGSDDWRPMRRERSVIAGHAMNGALLQHAEERVFARTVYRVGDRYVANEYSAKFWTLFDTVVHGRDDGALIVAYAVARDDRDLGAEVDRFLNDAFAGVDARLAGAMRR